MLQYAAFDSQVDLPLQATNEESMESRAWGYAWEKQILRGRVVDDAASGSMLPPAVRAGRSSAKPALSNDVVGAREWRLPPVRESTHLFRDAGKHDIIGTRIVDLRARARPPGS